MKVIDRLFAESDCDRLWSNVGSDGSIAILPNDADVLALTLPLKTGDLPLDDGLYAIVRLSWDAVSNGGSKFSIARKVVTAAVVGAASAGSMVILPRSSVPDVVQNPIASFDTYIGSAYLLSASRIDLGGAGDLTLDIGASTNVLFKAPVVGKILWVCPLRVKVATTATLLLAIK